MKPGPRRRPLAERFWSHVDKRGPDECWPWTAGTDNNGYGKINEGGAGGSMLCAHRVAWELKNGPIPEGMDVLHTCDHPPCCNDAHLFLGTPAANSADMAKKGRQARGERHGCVKLTAADVAEIRCSRRFLREIAVEYGICKQHASDIRLGKRWAHL